MAQKIFKDSNGNDIPVIYDKLPPSEEAVYRKNILKAGTKLNDNALTLPCNIIEEKDVAAALCDGTKIYTDVFRPDNSQKVPAVIAWSPYGKEFHGMPVEGIALSGLQKFEGPDPAYWVNKGYAVLNPDTRGIGNSDGDFCQWGRQLGKDGADFIQWAVEQSWCNGKVALCGNSYLSMVQWFIAEQQPSALAAIAPWEGSSDIYHDYFVIGGIPNPEFGRMVFSCFRGRNSGENVASMTERFPLYSSYWEDKIADLSKISVPAYVVASYASKVHTRGTLKSYMKCASKEKWLRIHNTHEWYDFYTHQDELCRFFDHYCKGIDNGWETTPKVRLSVLNPGGDDIVDRPEKEYPLSRTVQKTTYFNANDFSLSWSPVEEESLVTYQSDDNVSSISFSIKFDERTEIGENMVLTLWAESVGNNDMDLFVMANKSSASGISLPVEVSGAPYCVNGAAEYEWGNGHQRVSMRNSDDKSHFLEAGQIVPVKIELCPMGMIFEKGQILTIAISGYDPQTPELPGQPPTKTINKGIHVIHTGGKYQSTLTIPVVS